MIAPTSPQSSPHPPELALGVVAVVRFASELAMLGALGYTGFRLGSAVPALSVAFAVLLPVTAAVVWGVFIGPRARTRWQDPARLMLEIALFGAAATGLVVFGQMWWAVALGALYLIGTSHGRAGG